MDFEEAWKAILDEVGGALSKVEREPVTRLIELIESARRVFVAGAGRSGLMVRTFAMRLMQMGFETYVAGETTTPAIDKDLGQGLPIRHRCIHGPHKQIHAPFPKCLAHDMSAQPRPYLVAR